MTSKKDRIFRCHRVKWEINWHLSSEIVTSHFYFLDLHCAAFTSHLTLDIVFVHLTITKLFPFRKVRSSLYAPSTTCLKYVYVKLRSDLFCWGVQPSNAVTVYLNWFTKQCGPWKGHWKANMLNILSRYIYSVCKPCVSVYLVHNAKFAQTFASSTSLIHILL